MIKPRVIIKAKKAFHLILAALVVLFFIVLFALKDDLNTFISNRMVEQAGYKTIRQGSKFIDSAFNYRKNGMGYQYTFIEFGAKGCFACNQMEKVMQEVEKNYSTRVKVVFYNILLPESQELMKYFGIAVIPTQILLNVDGKMFFRHTGYISADELLFELFKEK